MERVGSMLWRTWKNKKKKKKNTQTVSTLSDDDLSSWEMINNNPSHDDADVLQQHHLLLSNDDDDDERPRLNDHDTLGSHDQPEQQVLLSLGITNHNNTISNMVSHEEEPFRIDPAPYPVILTTTLSPFLLSDPIDVMCDPVCNRLDEEEAVEDDVEYDDYDYDDSRWLRKQRMSKVGKKVNSGMMKKSNKLPRYFYNKFV